MEPFFKKTPLWLKLVSGAIPICLFVGSFFKLQTTAINNRSSFYKVGMDAKIVSSNSYQGRSVEFHTNNGFMLYFLPPTDEKMEIGDSIHKSENIFLYNVYRKSNSGEYTFFKTYDFKRIE